MGDTFPNQPVERTASQPTGRVTGDGVLGGWLPSLTLGGMKRIVIMEPNRPKTALFVGVLTPDRMILWACPKVCVRVGFMFYRFSGATGGEINRSPNFSAN